MWEMIGQDKIISLLQRSLGGGSLAHAYLFVGPPHVGKMTMALKLAQAVNCLADNPPCGECESCKKIVTSKHADTRIIGLNQELNSADSKRKIEISIEQIREMQHSSSLPPFEGKRKVFIIEEAERLSVEAANCLLKTLEEPVGGVMFILLTGNDRLLPSTVISRCQQLELAPVAAKDIESALLSKRGIESSRAGLLAKLCHGCPGWALSAAVDSNLLNHRAEMMGRLFDIINADYEGRFAYAAQLVTQFSKNRQLVYEVLDLWLDWWRDLLLVKVNYRDAIVNIDFLPVLSEMAQSYRLAQIKAVISDIQSAREQLGQNANPQLVLEVLMLSIPKSKLSGLSLTGQSGGENG